MTDNEIREEFAKRFLLAKGSEYHIGNSRIAADHLMNFYAKEAIDREVFIVSFLNSQNCIIDTEVMFRGSLSTSAVYPREIVKRVLELQSAAIVLSHNHPSGLVKPSDSDRKITKKLKAALEAIDVRILDHIVIGGDEYYSFADNNLI